jgi:iron-sulfur cluster assembly accessory protein
MTTDAETLPITVTERAAQRILKVMQGEADGAMLRVGVDGGGCSGFQYRFGVETAIETGDLVIERDGAKVVVDEVSLPFLTGATIDFVDDLIGQSFKVVNPNASASCGCGTSFSI